jgi:hypothetical protein
MRRQSSSKTHPCPTCGASGQNLASGQGACPTCQGSGTIPGEFPFTYHLPINLTVTQPGTYVGTQPSLVMPGAVPNPYQNLQQGQWGNNPANLQIPSENPFKWMFNLLSVSSPTVVGDASRFLALALFDIGSGNWPFQSSPIMANLFGGDAKNPWPQLEPLTFGELTNLQLIGYPVNYAGIVLVFGVGTGGVATFTATLNGPVLPGSLVITDPTGVISGTDSGGNGLIVGTGISGTINYTTGALSVTYGSDPATTSFPTATYTQGCALINAQFDLQGFYMKSLSQAAAQTAASSGNL